MGSEVIQSTENVSKVSAFVQTHNISAYADILAIVTAVLSVITFVNLIRTKKLIQKGLITKSVVSDATNAISKMDELKKFQRKFEWQIVLDLYAQIVTLLNLIKNSGLKFNSKDQQKLQDAISHFRQNENLIEKSLHRKIDIDHVKLNANISEQSDNLHTLLTSIKNEV